jgi:hypothetical protein
MESSTTFVCRTDRKPRAVGQEGKRGSNADKIHPDRTSRIANPVQVDVAQIFAPC